MSNNEKAHTIHIYVNQEQFARFRAAAMAYCIPVCAYIKQAALRQYNVDIKEYAKKLNAAKAEIIQIDYPGLVEQDMGEGK